MKLTGAQIVIECLKEQGVDTVFGYPGGAILFIYDELYKNKDRIRHILTSHEQGACHAADGYSRSTGKTGVVFATSGPGATNLVTGLATAYMDSIPLVAITCNVPIALLGKDSFQEVDISGITLPITKHSYILKKGEQIADAIREAFIVANIGRPGPVLIDIPKDVTAALFDYTSFTPLTVPKAEFIHKAGGLQRLIEGEPISDKDFALASALINSAEKPIIYAGGGIIASNAYAEVAELAEKADIPVCVSLMGKSAFPANHRLCTGMVGMHGTKASNTAINQADVIITLGARFSDRVISDPKKFATKAKILHIDIDEAEINKNVCAYESLIGNLKDILLRLLPLVEKNVHNEWNEKIMQLKSHVPSMYIKKTNIHPKFVCEYINKKLGDDTIIVTEVGQHQMWTAQFYPFTKPRTFLTSGGLGTMGYGTGAAIGAQLANPNQRIVHIAGDGSFRMNCNELATIEYYNLPIIIIVVNNGTLGMVRQWQNLFYEKRFSETTLDRGPDFVKLAEAYGICAFCVKDESEFADAFDRAVALNKPVVINAYINIDEMVLPMVPAGKSIEDTLLEVNDN
ncbi:MAG: biosynthetic-type acetolactate synthase large subunit [Spirochaetales bacterium]